MKTVVIAVGGGVGAASYAQRNPAFYIAVLYQIVDNILGFIDRNGKPEAFIAAGNDLSGIDADNLARRIDQRTARIAGIDGRVGLQAFDGIAGIVVNIPCQTGNDTLGGCPFQTAGIAQRHDLIAQCGNGIGVRAVDLDREAAAQLAGQVLHTTDLDGAGAVLDAGNGIIQYDQYLKELFEVEPFRFLSKPVNDNKFCRYFREACQRIGETEVFYQFTFNKEIKKVPLKDIVYFESRNRMVYIYFRDNSFEHFYGKLNDVEKELTNSRQYFLRTHQSFLVNYDYIKKMNFFNVTVSIGGKEIELKISEDRQKEVRRQLCEIAGGKAVVE